MRVELRPARADEYEFARQLYYETMRWIVEPLFGWNQARQDASFAAQFKLEEVRIIVVDGNPAGWIQTQTDEASVTPYTSSTSCQPSSIEESVLGF